MIAAPLDLDALRALVEPITPTASVYLGLDPSTTSGRLGRDRDLRWRTLAAQLLEQGADRPTVEALGGYLMDEPAFPAETAAFGRDGRVVFAQHLPLSGPLARDAQDLARFDELPAIAPLLAWRQYRPAHVLVVVDRTGADVIGMPEGSVAGRHREVTGPDDEIERNAPGGWSQPRYQRRAEDSWQHNASAVAEAVGREVERLGAGLLLIAGDVRAVQLLEERLPEAVRQSAVIRHVPGGRSPDGSEPVRAAAEAEALDEYVRADTEGLLREQLPAGVVHNGAVVGVADTIGALAAGRVSTLFATAYPDDRRRAWCGRMLLCAADGDPVVSDPVAELRPGRLLDVVLRAALLTDASVRLLSPDPDEAPEAPVPAEGIGALCRF